MRGRRIALIVICLVLFVVISGLLARAFSIDGAERSAITSLIQAEASGNPDAMVSKMNGCAARAACRARAVYDAARLRRPGKVLILDFNSSAGFSLGSTLGIARVAWRVGSALPIVQCVRVRHAGNILSGLHVELLDISTRIKSDTDCPGVSTGY